MRGIHENWSRALYVGNFIDLYRPSEYTKYLHFSYMSAKFSKFYMLFVSCYWQQNSTTWTSPKKWPIISNQNFFQIYWQRRLIFLENKDFLNSYLWNNEKIHVFWKTREECFCSGPRIKPWSVATTILNKDQWPRIDRYEEVGEKQFLTSKLSNHHREKEKSTLEPWE